MKLTSWNVNSVRARITNIVDYIKQSNPDILLLQEIKTQDISFPMKIFKALDIILMFSVKKVTMVLL